MEALVHARRAAAEGFSGVAFLSLFSVFPAADADGVGGMSGFGFDAIRVCPLLSCQNMMSLDVCGLAGAGGDALPRPGQSAAHEKARGHPREGRPRLQSACVYKLKDCEPPHSRRSCSSRGRPSTRRRRLLAAQRAHAVLVAHTIPRWYVRGRQRVRARLPVKPRAQHAWFLLPCTATGSDCNCVNCKRWVPVTRPSIGDLSSAVSLALPVVLLVVAVPACRHASVSDVNSGSGSCHHSLAPRIPWSGPALQSQQGTESLVTAGHAAVTAS